MQKKANYPPTIGNPVNYLCIIMIGYCDKTRRKFLIAIAEACLINIVWTL